MTWTCLTEHRRASAGRTFPLWELVRTSPSTTWGSPVLQTLPLCAQCLWVHTWTQSNTSYCSRVPVLCSLNCFIIEDCNNDYMLSLRFWESLCRSLKPTGRPTRTTPTPVSRWSPYDRTSRWVFTRYKLSFVFLCLGFNIVFSQPNLMWLFCVCCFSPGSGNSDWIHGGSVWVSRTHRSGKGGLFWQSDRLSS